MLNFLHGNVSCLKVGSIVYGSTHLHSYIVKLIHASKKHKLVGLFLIVYIASTTTALKQLRVELWTDEWLIYFQLGTISLIAIVITLYILACHLTSVIDNFR